MAIQGTAGIPGPISTPKFPVSSQDSAKPCLALAASSQSGTGQALTISIAGTLLIRKQSSESSPAAPVPASSTSSFPRVPIRFTYPAPVLLDCPDGASTCLNTALAAVPSPRWVPHWDSGHMWPFPSAPWCQLIPSALLTDTMWSCLSTSLLP